MLCVVCRYRAALSIDRLREAGAFSFCTAAQLRSGSKEVLLAQVPYAMRMGEEPLCVACCTLTLRHGM